MKRSLPLISSLLLASALAVSARIFVPAPATTPTRGAVVNSPSSFIAPYEALPKLDATLTLLANGYQQATQFIATRGATQVDSASLQQTTPDGTFQLLNTVAFNIQTTENKAEAVAQQIQQLGGTARVITENFLLVEIPIAQLQTLSQLADVVEMAMPQRAYPFLKEARSMSHVDEVHAGKELYTPFRGKDVIIAVIDQSFEFRHAAFLDKDGNSRVKWLWDRSGYSTQATSNRSKSATQKVPVGTDLQDHGAGGHGTHTTGIAAGSDVGNGQYGVAPEADIIMIPSTFLDTEVLEDVRFVRTQAKKAQKPWVVNMSFGSQEGPHDGSTGYDQNMSLVGKNKGGILVASAGNDGDRNIHMKRNIAVGDSCFILFDYLEYDKLTDDQKKSKTFTFDLWSQSTDKVDRIEVTPFLFINNKVVYKDASYWKSHAWFHDAQSKFTHKYQSKFWIKLPQVRMEENDATILFGLRLKNISKDQAELVHGWVSQNGAYITKTLPKVANSRIVKGDNDYTVADAGGNIPAAITVGAYTSRNTHTNKITKKSFNFPDAIGKRSYFSSMGPVLNDKVKKPTVLGPGAQVCSAMNKLHPGFDETFWLMSEKVKVNGEDYYYADMQGTSMSAPFVSGVIALWLEANPNLDYKDIEEIIDKTSYKISKGSINNWTKQEGYGRIDAYKGLKMALEMAGKDPLTSIERVSGSAQPVTLQGDGSVWNVLFNNPERSATISLVGTDGRVALQRNLQQVSQGHEETFDLTTLTPGVYFLRIVTPGAQITHKVVVNH